MVKGRVKNKDTRMYRVDGEHPERHIVRRCADIIRSGGLVAFPTETVYGLGADAQAPAAIENLFTAKNRPGDNPLIVHTKHSEAAFQLACHVPPAAKKLAALFWPGPLTLVLRKGSGLPAVTTGGLDTFGVRVPAHPVALMLLEEADVAIAAPSANVSGRPSPTRAQHVVDDLWGFIDAVLDGGPTQIGLESTVLDMTVTPPVILRPGGITVDEIRKIVPDVGFLSTPSDRSRASQRPRSPGLKYRHYAPEASVRQLSGTPEEIARRIRRLTADGTPSGTGYIVSKETAASLQDDGADGFTCHLVVIGSRFSPREAARQLYDALRRLDRPNITDIFVETFDRHGIGVALADRVERATGGSDPSDE